MAVDWRLRLLEAQLTRRTVLRGAVAGAAALTIPGLLEACGSSSTGTGVSNKQIDTLNWGVGATIRSLDLAHSFDTNSSIVQNLGMETLTTFTNDQKIAPLLAESYSQPDPMRYVYKIRAGVKFWDGSPLTADDVVFSLNRNIDPKVSSQVGGYYANVKSIEATGPLEVTLHMSNPDPVFASAAIYTPITSKAFATAQGSKFGTAAGSTITVMGTGPYQYTSFEADKGVSAVRFEGYWGQKPVVKNINLKFITDAQTLQLAYRSGEVDGVFSVPLAQSEQWASIAHSRMTFKPGMIVWALCMDVTKAPFSDIHVRRAFAYACDRKGIVSALLHGHGQPATSLVPPEQWVNLLTPDKVTELYSKIQDYPFDISKAKAELAQSSVPSGFSTSIKVLNSAVYYQQAMLNHSQNLKQIGINMDVQSVTSDAWLNHLYAHDLPLQFLGYYPDYPDPWDYPAITYPSSAAVPNQFNISNYKNPTVDALIKDQATASNAQRATDLGQLMVISNQDLPYYAMWWEDDAMVIHDKFIYNGFNGMYYNQMWAGNIRSAT